MISRVTKSVQDNDGNSIGIEHPSLFADQSLYEVSFPNGLTEEFTENVIAESMLSQEYSERHYYQVLKETSYHYAYGNALKSSNAFIRSHCGNLHTKKITRCLRLEFK